MKRHSMLLAMVLLLLLSFAAQAEITITYMHRTVPLETEWAQRIVAAFEAEHPGIKVELLAGGGGNEYIERLALLVAAGEAPDVHYGTSDRLLPIHSGWILELDEFVERDAEEIDIDDFLPGVFDSYRVNGKLYGLPLNVFTQVVFWNKDMFAEHGLPPLGLDWDSEDWTWEEFLDVSARLTKVGPDGIAQQLGVSRVTDLYLPDITWMFGGDWFGPEAYAAGKAVESTMTRPENVRAYEEMTYLYANFAAEGPPKGIDIVRGFQQGKLGMDWIGSWKVKQYLTETQAGGMGFDWGMAPVPLAESRANTRWVDALFIYSGTPHAEAAWEFVKFATGEYGQALWSELTGDIPARSSVMPVYMDKIADTMGLSDAELFGFVNGAVAHSRRAVEESILGVGQLFTKNMRRWFNPIIMGNVPARTGLETVKRELDAHLKELL